jgi:hypothetical protein
MKHLLLTALAMALAFVIGYPIGVRQATDRLDKMQWESQLECFDFPTPSITPTPTIIDQSELLKGKPAGMK